MAEYWDEEKDPADIDYLEAEVNADWLGAESIANATFVPADSAGLAVTNVGVQGATVRAQVSGGNIGTHGIEVTVTTSSGRVRQRTLYLVIRQK